MNLVTNGLGDQRRGWLVSFGLGGVVISTGCLRQIIYLISRVSMRTELGSAVGGEC